VSSFGRSSLLAVLALCSATMALAADEDPNLDAEAQTALEEAEDNAAAPPEKLSGLDWSVGLRGSYAANSLTGGAASISLTPEASLTLGGESGLTVYGVGGEVIIDGVGQARIAEVRAGIEHSYQLGAQTLFEGAVDGSFTQASPEDSGLPANTLIAPMVLDGRAQASLTQDMGRVDGRLTLDGERQSVGVTTLDDLSTVDNSHQSFWQGGATLRFGYELTPLLTSFVEGEVRANKFDAPDPTLLKYLDGRTYELRAGLAYAQGSMIAAEASLGRAWLDYFDGTISDTQSWVYNGSLTVRPDETLSLKGALETTIGPSTTVPGDTDVGYVLSSEASYDVNPWLTLRGTAGWSRTVTLGTGDDAWGYDLGAGLDYRSSRHIVWTADYSYARDFVPPTPLNDTHTVTVGVKVTR
jgi:hypothetical protein